MRGDLDEVVCVCSWSILFTLCDCTSELLIIVFLWLLHIYPVFVSIWLGISVIIEPRLKIYVNFHIFALNTLIGVWQALSTCSNVLKLLFQRELCPHTKRTPRKFWGKACTHHVKSYGFKSGMSKDVRQELRSWYFLVLFSIFGILNIDYIMTI